MPKENHSIRICTMRSSGLSPSDYPDGTVVGVLQAGYMFHGKVLRPAMVRVTANAAQQTCAAELNSRSGEMAPILKECGVKPASRRF